MNKLAGGWIDQLFHYVGLIPHEDSVSELN